MGFTRDDMDAAFRRHAGVDPAALGPESGFAALVEWYRGERAVDAEPLDQDGDMLLFQWSSKPGGIEVDLTRQVIWLDRDDPADEDGEPVFMQLSLAFHFPADSRSGIDRSGNRWCHNLDQLDEFVGWMVATPAYRHAVANDAIRGEVSVSEV